MKHLSRRAALAGTLALAGAARADEPPLRLVLGFPPGASSDTLTRLIADKVAELATFYLAFGMGAGVPAKTLAEYAALAKTGGIYANFASAAAGSLPHFF